MASFVAISQRMTSFERTVTIERSGTATRFATAFEVCPSFGPRCKGRPPRRKACAAQHSRRAVRSLVVTL